jgi:tetratricopeptide (TPR) repeat protein
MKPDTIRAVRRFAAAAALASALPAALAQPQTASFPERLQPYYDTLLAEGEWGAVLNLERLGLEAIDQGQPEVAARALDGAIARIELVYADSPSAKKARSLWSSEGVKDFKGDPYERVMAYYYRGLLFLAEGDYGNARAAFRSAEYQDTIASDESHAGDFGLMSLLAGWASHCAGDAGMAEEFYQRAATQQPQGLVAPAAGSGTLVLVESGTSPVKSATGGYGEALQFKAGDNPFVAVSADDGQAVPLLADVGWQARTLGGRQVDVILDGKASFREGAEGVGSVGMLGMQAALSQGDSGAAGALAVVGIAAILVSSATKPKADIRYWDNLPDRIYGRFLAGSEAPLASVSETDADGGAWPVAAPVLDRQAGACRLVLHRTREPATLRTQAVTNLSEPERRKLYKHNEQRDRAFRDEMAALFVADDVAMAVEE